MTSKRALPGNPDIDSKTAVLESAPKSRRRNSPGHRTEQANTRTDQANTRTEQAEARSVEAIRASELRYRRLFETAQDGILILDAETGQVVDANPFMKDLLGYSQEEFLGRKLWEIGPFKGAAASKIAFAELQHTDCIHYEGLSLETKDGRRVEVEFISNAFVAEQRRLIQCNIRDITERKRAEAERERFFTLSLDLLCIVGFDGYFQRLNPAFQKTLGFTEAEMREKPLLEFVHPDDRDATTAEVGRLKTGASTLNFDNRYRCKDGSYRWLSWTAAPFPEDGTLYAVARDITERRKLEEQFRQSQKMEAIGQLAGGVAHDFNNILAVIQMQSDMLKASEELSPEHREFAEDISTATQRAASLTHQLLLFSRKETMRQQDLDLNQSINNMTKMLRRTLGEDIQMQFKFAMQSLFIHADAGMMDQVLMNLAVNSRDAMLKGGQLIIETSLVDFDELAVSQSGHSRSGSFVCLSVSDTGCGIPPEVLPKIFEPFYTTKEVGKGTGLGLATVFGVVQQHQGWINVYSEVGHGTTFRIYLPHVTKMSGQKSEQSLQVDMPRGNETILLAEDDAFLRASVQNALSLLGYHVIKAINGVDALEVWKHNRDKIHLLLTDLVMPGGMTGIELGQQLLKENPKLKVIYASGYSAGVADKDFPLREGVNFLTKPFRAAKLAQTVRNTLDASG
jgi:two-component system, cell cycle sensor histidine kinase and response regulator CckA